MTKRDYYAGDALVMTATVAAVTATDHGPALELEATVFCPKGGGQLCDLGTIGGVQVEAVVYGENDRILHVIESSEAFAVGDLVELAVDASRRKLNCRLHTAGHLVAQTAEAMILGSKARQGHHWPGEARVEVDLNGAEVPGGFLESLGDRVSFAVAEDRAVTKTDGLRPPRTVTIDGFPPLPCGGTHVRTLAELNRIGLRNVKVKKGVLRIGYEC